MSNRTFSSLNYLECKEVEILVSRFVDGELDGRYKEEFEKHILQCYSCAELLNDVKQIVQMASTLKSTSLPQGVKARLRKSLQEKVGHPANCHNARLWVVK